MVRPFANLSDILNRSSGTEYLRVLSLNLEYNGFLKLLRRQLHMFCINAVDKDIVASPNRLESRVEGGKLGSNIAFEARPILYIVEDKFEVPGGQDISYYDPDIRVTGEVVINKYLKTSWYRGIALKGLPKGIIRWGSEA